MENVTILFERYLKYFDKLLLSLPIIGSLAFLISYFFELGYFTAYKIPGILSEVRTENFLLSLIIAGLLLFLAVSTYSNYVNERHQRWSNGFNIITGALFLFVLLGMLPFIFSIFILIILLMVYLIQKKPKKQNSKKQELSKMRLVLSLIFLIFVATSGSSYAFGTIWAQFENSFPTYEEDGQKYAILRVYGEKILVGAYVEDSEIEHFKVLKYEQLSSKYIKNEDLKIEHQNTANTIRRFISDKFR